MRSLFEISFFSAFCFLIVTCFHEQYRVPNSCSKNWESYFYYDKEYILQNLPVSWENAKILCRGHHNGSLAILDTMEKAQFVAEAMSESQLSIESIWVGARRESADDPAGYRWSHGIELRRTALDVIADDEKNLDKHYPLWVNRTHVPVPDQGADCVGLDRVDHDKPVFLDLPCNLERPFVCEKEATPVTKISELKTVKCRTGLYKVFDGTLDWHQAAAYCVLHKMTLANIATMRCLKKLGTIMLKTRPSIENAWVGARGTQGKWWWVDSGADLFAVTAYNDAAPGVWPPLRDRTSLKQEGCLQLDRHATHSPVFLEARCERKMQFICYQNAAPSLRTAASAPSDDTYYYILVREALDWQQAFDNCLKMKGTLANVETSDTVIQLLLVMGENKDKPIGHIWLSGRLNSTRDSSTGDVALSWINPVNKKRIPESKTVGSDVNLPPWLDEDSSLDSPCLNLDRQDHLKGLVYGMPCDVQQYSICMVEKSLKLPVPGSPAGAIVDNTTAVATGYETE